MAVAAAVWDAATISPFVDEEIAISGCDSGEHLNTIRDSMRFFEQSNAELNVVVPRHGGSNRDRGGSGAQVAARALVGREGVSRILLLVALDVGDSAGHVDSGDFRDGNGSRKRDRGWL